MFQRVGDEVPFINKMPILGVFETPLTKAEVSQHALAIVRSDAVNERNKGWFPIVKYRNEKLDLVRIGQHSSENDLQKLLQLILSTCREILCADAGSIYIRRGRSTVEPSATLFPSKSLRTILRILAGCPSIRFRSTVTIAGYVALTARSLNIDDVERLDESVPYRAGSGH